MGALDLFPFVLICLTMACVMLGYLGLVVLPAFEYRFYDGILTIRRRAFRVLPAGTWRVHLANVLRAEHTGLWRSPLRGETYCAGRVWAREGVLLVLRQALDGFERIYVTPASPESFMAELARRLGDAVLQPAPPPTAAQRRAAVKRGDAVALVSAVALVVWLSIITGESLVLFALTRRLLIVAACCMAASLPMVVWMLSDCVYTLGERRQGRLGLWLAVMFFFFPIAWPYYLLEWRVRNVGGPKRP
jgi:hypothetical protein